MREIFSRVMDSIKKNINRKYFCVTYERVDASGILSSNKSEKFNSFISSWGRFFISGPRIGKGVF